MEQGYQDELATCGGSAPEFVGNAVIRQKTEDGTCRIRFEHGKNDDAVLGSWVITE